MRGSKQREGERGVATLSMYSSPKLVLRGMWDWWQQRKEVHENGSAWHIWTGAVHHWEGTTYLSRNLPTKSGSYLTHLSLTVQILSKIRRVQKERKKERYAILQLQFGNSPLPLDFTWIAALANLFNRISLNKQVIAYALAPVNTNIHISTHHFMIIFINSYWH